MLYHAYGPPNPPPVFAFLAGAVLAFGGVTTEFGGGSGHVQLSGSFHFLSAGLAVGAAWLASLVAPSLLGWAPGASVATAAYLVVVGAKNTVADRRSGADG